MMISTKAMSSPSRTEKFPPPLMKFLRSNVGGRSRGKPRSSPMFIRKKNNTAAVVETTHEPSSPKVTCIGQVRAHRPSSGKPTTTRPCHWLKKHTLSFPNFVQRIKPKSFCSGFDKWVGSFRFGWCRKVEVRDESAVVLENGEENRGNGVLGDINIEKEEEGVDEELESCEALDSSSATLHPPKNAFLLTRCGSAPYRSSSLANRFWESETVDSDGAGKVGEERETERPISEVEPNCRDSISEPRIDEEIEPNLGEIVDSISGKAEEIRIQEVGTTTILVLMRCKSEPARTGERLNPVARFDRDGEREGLVFTEPSSPRVTD